MPSYTCTVAESTFSADKKRALAGEIARIHSSMIHVPSTYVNVAFHELAADDLYAGGAPASSVLVTGWVREGHPADDTTKLATEISAAVTKIFEIDVERVLVVIRHPTQPSPFGGGRWPCAARAGSRKGLACRKLTDTAGNAPLLLAIESARQALSAIHGSSGSA
jgi:phenylpyruvate tautomerase PptA (4-oxalocrotonate tautomerase family)